MTNTLMEARVETLEKCVEALASEAAKINRRLDGNIQDKLDKITEMLASLNSNAAPRLDFPRFSGGDPLAWISRAERYFDLCGTTEAAKVEVGLGGMDGAAFNWAEWVVRRRPDISWKELVDEIVCVYGENRMVSPFEALLGTTQTGTVEEYIDAFVSRALHVKGLSDSHCLGVFMHGLREDIRLRIRSKDAKDILETMYLAREIERELLFVTLKREGEGEGEGQGLRDNIGWE